jgi:S-formylglutathione hydrolase FrmB
VRIETNLARWAGAAALAVVLAAGAAEAQVAVEKITVHGASLEGNLEGDSPDREVYVYLPPSYASEPDRRYPVVYSLHGYGINAERWDSFLGTSAALDRAFAAGAREFIVVAPNAQTLHLGSFYSNSVTTGDWESFIADDLVGAIDSRYRTIADRDSRGIGGHSMGGYGSFRVAMKRPEVFGSIFAMSSCCFMPVGAGGPAGNIEPSPLEGISTLEQANAVEFPGRVSLAFAAAWAPDPQKPPLYFDAPTKDGEPLPEVVAAMAANATTVMVHQYMPALRSMNAITMDIGLQDGLLAGNQRMDEILTSYGVEHGFQTYEGDHGDKIPERFEMHMIPFFSEHLAFE